MPGAAEPAVGEHEAGGLDDRRVGAETGAGAQHRAGVGGDVGFEQRQRESGVDPWRPPGAQAAGAVAEIAPCDNPCARRRRRRKRRGCDEFSRLRPMDNQGDRCEIAAEIRGAIVALGPRLTASTRRERAQRRASARGSICRTRKPSIPAAGTFCSSTTGAVAAVGAAAVVWPLIDQMNPDASTLALSSIEVDLAPIQEGQIVTVKWRGGPVFIRHRTKKEIEEAEATPLSELKDPQTDQARVQKPEWLIVIGVCTHLGCVPLGHEGQYDGWKCPCHGSVYDTSGRIRQGPAPLNLVRARIQFPDRHEGEDRLIALARLASPRPSRELTTWADIRPTFPRARIARWFEARLPIVGLVHSSFVAYPVPRNLNYFWTFGAILSFMLVIQIVTGVILAMHYVPSATLAFASVEHIMRDVNYGWLIRYLHTNGASFFFLAVYIHIFRGMYYGSYKAPREVLWILGVIIYVLMMATAFMGYVLPWGMMSFAGATVITNLFTAIPLVGTGVAHWLWGGYAVGDPTLNRFFALHYLLPFMIVGVVVLHVWALHVVGQNNPDGVEVKNVRARHGRVHALCDDQGRVRGLRCSSSSTPGSCSSFRTICSTPTIPIPPTRW